jgi:hypothetical protein
MGSGSFSGGSGGFGGGGSGGTGSRRGGGSRSTTTDRRKDSSFARLKAVFDLTRLLNRDSGAKAARQAIVEQLANSSRRNHLLQLLGDPFVNAVFGELFRINDRLSTGTNWATIGAEYRLPKTASLLSLRYALIAAHQTPGTDERFVDITGTALSDLFLRGVNDKLQLYSEQPLDKMADVFDLSILQLTCNIFMASVIRELVRRDSLELSEASMGRLDTVAHQLADAFVARFIREHHEKDGTQHRLMLATMAAHPDEVTECLA